MADTKLLDIEIVTPQKVIFAGKASSVSVPGSLSAFQVLYNHAPIVSSLDAGIVKIVDSDSNKRYFAIKEGFTEVRNNKVSILVDSAFFANEIDIDSENRELQIATDKLNASENSEEKAKIKNDIKFIQNKIKAFNKQKGIE